MFSFIKKYILNPHLFTFYLDGGGGQPAPSSQNVTQTSIPEYAKPYVERMLGKAEATINQPYQAYGGERIAGFTPMQQQAQQGMANLGPAQQLGTATQMAGLAGLNAANINYQGGDFANQYQRPAGFRSGAFANQYQGPQAYQAGMFGTSGVSAPSLQQFQMGPAERVGTQSFVGPGTVEAYMSPYQQAVTDIETREAMRQSNIMAQQSQARASQQGAFGGSRTAMVEAERQRNLGQQMGDIQARGSQAAFQQAQQQFNAEQQARMQAQMANQQAGLTVGGRNLEALLGVQQLGAGQSMQSQLANQQMRMEAQRMREQSRQYGYGQSMTNAQLAAQYGTEAQRMREQSRQFGYGQDMTAAQLRAQYGTEAQRMQEQSRQFGANLGLQGLQQQIAAASTLGQLGQTQFGQQKDIIQGQASMGQQQQALEQQRLQQQYQDFLNQRAYPQQQLAWFADMTRGLPLSQSTQQMYQAPPSALSQYGGLALAGYGMSRKAGGPIKESKAPAGLSELLLYDMENA
jgi:hypothetical protein